MSDRLGPYPRQELTDMRFGLLAKGMFSIDNRQTDIEAMLVYKPIMVIRNQVRELIGMRNSIAR